MMTDSYIPLLATKYFADLESDGRTDNEDNLTAWLWFSCPADLRTAVREQIENLRAASVDRRQ